MSRKANFRRRDRLSGSLKFLQEVAIEVSPEVWRLFGRRVASYREEAAKRKEGQPS